MNHVGDTLTCERLLTETPFDIVQNLGVSGVRLIEDVLEGKIRGAKAVAEVLRKDPARVWSLPQKENINGNETRTHKRRPRPAQRAETDWPQRRGYPEDNRAAKLLS